MRTVFVDNSYWIAIVRPQDQWQDAAKKARRDVGPAVLVTTDEVMTEFLAGLSKAGPTSRLKAAQMVRTIHKNPNVRVLPQSRDSFLRGLQRYADRADKEYSLTDCISMNVMEGEGIEEVLTNDHHFEQEGFTVLMKK
jgi:predicted nucleic acid-binding protein